MEMMPDVASRQSTLEDAVWLNQQKLTIKQNLLRLNYEFDEFLYWLIIPKLEIILTFDKQRCVQVNRTLL